jgi:hypothetical protein
MDLQEKIARLIDPNVWHYADLNRHDTPISARVLTEPSLTAARRVIDRLGLTEWKREMAGTVEHRLATPWEPEEDA